MAVDDGIVFDPASVMVEEIRKEAGYGGVRVIVAGDLASRLKDYFDRSVLLERETLDSELLAQAIRATFERRGMAVPDALPVGLTDEFANDASRQSLWLAFLRKNELTPEPLTEVVGRLGVALASVLMTKP